MNNVWDRQFGDRTYDQLMASINYKFTQAAWKTISSFIEGEKTFLEAGCGSGRFCYLLSLQEDVEEVVGIDKSEKAIETANKLADLSNKGKIIFKEGDILKLPFEDNSFDFVFNEGVIEHFTESEQYIILHEMKRVARKKVVVTVPNFYNLPHTIYKRFVGEDYKFYPEKSFTHKELRKLFEECGFKDIELKGWRPSLGLARLRSKSIIFPVVGIFVDLLQNIFDPLTKGLFSKTFGFQIAIKGVIK